MARTGHKTLIALSTVVFSSVLSTPSSAQNYEARSGLPPAYGHSVLVDSVPTFSIFKPPASRDLQRGWSCAGPGAVEVRGHAEHWYRGSYEANAGAQAGFLYDDVIFTSAGGGPINVGLLLTIDGFARQEIGGQVRLKLVAQHGAVLGTARLDGGGVSTTGLLTGWDMQSPFSFQYDFAVDVNTPQKLGVIAGMGAYTGVQYWEAEGQYRLRFGGPDEDGPIPVFSLPDGVTVDSVQGGIQNNLWEASSELYLTPSEPDFEAGESLDLTTWNGTPDQVFALMITDVDGVPYSRVMVIRPLNSDGKSWVGAFPHDPALSGHSFGFLSASMDENDATVVSARKSVTIH